MRPRDVRNWHIADISKCAARPAFDPKADMGQSRLTRDFKLHGLVGGSVLPVSR